jgi:rhomboid protease GluP
LPLPYRWQVRVERLKTSMRGLFGGGGSQQRRPRICPACGTLVGISATRCHQCGTSLNFSMAAINRRFAGVFGGAAPVTTVLLIVNILMFGVCMVATMKAGEGGGLNILWHMDAGILYRLGALWSPAIVNGEPWRLVTAMFLHGGLLHIGFNMMVLMDIGPAVEEVYGSSRYLFLYTAVGIVGYVFSAFTPLRTQPVLAVGASGAILGLIGLMIGITTRRGGATMQAMRSRLVSWVVSIFVFGFLMSGIDNWAHFGGLASGFLLGKVFADRQPMNASEVKTASALGWLAGAVLLASFVFMFRHFRDPVM